MRAQGAESRLPGILAPATSSLALATSCGVVLDPDILVEVGLGFLLAGDGDVSDELLFGFRAGVAERRVSYASPAWKIFKDGEDPVILDCLSVIKDKTYQTNSSGG